MDNEQLQPRRPASGNLNIPLEGDRQDRLFDMIAQTGVVEASCRAVGYSKGAFFGRVRRDPVFLSLYEVAMERYRDLLRSEVHRRAVKGTQKPVYFKGEKCGEVTEYSDRLLEMHIRRHDPAYRDRSERLNINATAELGPATMGLLNKRQQAALRAMLLQEQDPTIEAEAQDVTDGTPPTDAPLS